MDDSVEVELISSRTEVPRKRLLIVDDEPFNLVSLMVLLRASMKKLGHSEKLIDEFVDRASDGQQALDKAMLLLEQHQNSYGLVISDCQMPNMDGYDFCSRLRDFYADNEVDQPYIVACTGNVEASQIEKAWQSKFDELVAKPATMEVFRQILSEVVEVQLD